MTTPRRYSRPNPPVFRITAAAALCALGVAGFTAQAGDILRGGAPAGQTPTAAAATTTAAQTAQSKQNAKDALARTSMALESVKKMQAAAQKAYANGADNAGADPNHPGMTLPNVPNGLGVGGLQVAPGVSVNSPLWIGANLPTQTANGGRANVTIKQTSQQAILNWKTFNIGRNTTLYFDQSLGGSQVGQWIAFNKVLDPSGSPSQILGSIQAAGQVYVINQNGIIFGAGSQVNVHALTASALPINDNLVERGLLNNPDAQFLFSALPLPAGAQGTPGFTPTAPLTPSGKVGDVTVQKGAFLTAPSTSSGTGGRIALIGANVKNEGTISTPDGQTILAAGLQVGFAAHRTDDPSLRGLDTFVGAVEITGSPLGLYAGVATNSGLIDAPRGNVTITGKEVEQLGVIYSTTSVSLNGRVDLNASYDAVTNTQYDPVQRPNIPPFLFSKTGGVTLGKGSVISVVPETWSPDAIAATRLPLNSQVNIQGLTVHMGRDSVIMAPSGDVTINAGTWNYVSTGTPSSQFVYSKGQIYLEPGSLIYVAGTPDVPVPVTQNIVTVQLRGSELADVALQRFGALRGQDILIDIRRQGTYNGIAWVGTPLADATGYLGLIQRTAAELTTMGGNVKLNAGSVVVQKGATVDVSGGYLSYQGAMVKTSRLLSGGQLFDIWDAIPDLVYDGIYDGTFTEVHHPKWGPNTSRTYTVPFMTGERYEMGYTYGGDGGTISITAPSMALDGALKGQTIMGPRQRELPPVGSSLSLAFQAQSAVAPNYLTTYPTPPNIIFKPGVTQAAAAPFTLNAAGEPDELREDRLSLVVLSPELLTTSGFSSLTVNNPDGEILIPAGVEVAAPAGGAIILSGSNINVQGSAIAPGGNVSLTAYNLSPAAIAALRITNNPILPQPNEGRGVVTVGSDALISTAGVIADDRFYAPAPYTQPLATDGGTISIIGYSAILNEGSTLDVSGGVEVNPLGQRTYGDGGSIVIKAGQDPGLLAVLGGELKLEAVLKGYSGAKGGSLTIQAPIIQIGGHAAHPDTLLLQPNFFSQGGFGSFTLIGLGALGEEPGEYVPGITIAPGTRIRPIAKRYLAVPHVWGEESVVMTPIDVQEGLRTPVSLSFQAPGVRDDFTQVLVVRGDFVMGEGSSIETDALGSVTIKGDTAAVLGSITAPGGIISISGGNTFPAVSTGSDPLVTVHIGPNAVLSTAGKTVYTPNRWGHNTGTVYAGGIISLTGNVFADAGAVLDVSGTSGIVDVPIAYLGLSAPGYQTLEGQPIVPAKSGINSPLYSSLYLPQRVDSNGGTIVLDGGEILFVDAELRGSAGGPNALGGTLYVSSGRYYPPNSPPATPADINLVVTQNGQPIPSGFYPDGESAIGYAVRDGQGNVIPGMGYFSVDKFQRGGFDNLALGGTVQFSGPVNVDARGWLAVASGGFLYADSPVRLSAPYVALGTPFQPPLQATEQVPIYTVAGQPFYFSPTFGPGSLTVVADLIDIGNLSLQNIGSARFFADGGDIRGNGSLDVAGSIYMRAAQVYPTTMGTFNITAYDQNIRVATSSTLSSMVTLVSPNLPPGFGVGSTLLGRVVTAINGTQVTLAGNANAAITNGWTVITPGSGTVSFASSRTVNLPLSGGGTLNVNGSVINQGGVLRAPLGAINLGWDGTGTAPLGKVTNQAAPVTQQLTLLPGSITSVSAIDPITGQGILIPYGVSYDGITWLDPSGVDISISGPPNKLVTLNAANLTTMAGSTIDIRGGGDLYAYQWVSGTGGTRDILASSSSFAVVPGYQALYAPYAEWNNTAGADALQDNPGYVNDGISVGDQIYLSASSGLPGIYTLLPARYALLPGAFMVTPQSGAPLGLFERPDGSSFVMGYRVNSLNSSAGNSGLYSRYEVAPGAVVRDRAQYIDFYATEFIAALAEKRGEIPPRLPNDSGQLVFAATQAMTIQGDVLSIPLGEGRGSLIDISSPIDIIIGGPGVTAAPGTLVLDATKLTGFAAESLLIGGRRTITTAGIDIDVRTSSILVDNAGAPLIGSEIILASRGLLTLADGAIIQQTGTVSEPARPILIGDSAVPGSGDGTLLRVTSDLGATLIRTGLSSSTTPQLNVGEGVVITAGSIILDSTSGFSLDPSAILQGQAITLNAGQISFLLDDPGAVLPTTGLVLAGPALLSLQSAQALSFTSYTSIDIYGTGQVGSAGLGSLALHAAQFRGFNNEGGTATFAADNVSLDNAPGRPALAVVAAPAGTLRFEAGTITLGANNVDINQYAEVQFNASSALLVRDTGRLTTTAAVDINTPLITAVAGADHGIIAGGALTIQAPGGANATGAQAGLGGRLSLTGASIVQNSAIVLPSGLLTMLTTSGNLTVGGTIDVSGTAQQFYDTVKYTSAGSVSLTSTTGDVVLDPGSVIDLSAADRGDAGTLLIRTPQGSFTVGGSLSAQAGAGGKGGTFSLDVGAMPLLSSVGGLLTQAGFSESQSIRVRTGDVVVDGVTAARTFILSADLGNIDVIGTIDASGETGGRIELVAGQGLTLFNGSVLTVGAEHFNNAGKGGAIVLETRGQGGGVLDIQTGSTIDLTVDSAAASSPAYGQFTGTLHLRAPQIAGTEVAIDTIDGTILGASVIIAEGYQIYDLTGSGGLITAAVQNSVMANGNTFIGTAGNPSATYNAMLNRLLQNNAGLDPVFSIRAGAEIINTTGDLTLGTTVSTATSDWNLAGYRFGPDRAPGIMTLRAAGNLVFFNALSDGFNTSAYTSELMNYNPALPMNAQSWSYRLAAGADLSAAHFRQVQPLANLGATVGNLQLGKNAGINVSSPTGANATTSSGVGNRYQVIRTGSGDIDIVTGRSVQLLNHFATIYTAGTKLPDATILPDGSTFEVPILNQSNSGPLGGSQQTPPYPAQYTMGGGNISIVAGSNIEHLTRNNLNQLISDSVRQLPVNWLYRRGYINPATGEFGNGRWGETASTTWWVDFSNFFEGIGALGGGNITMIAGSNISNVDAAIPTNARMAEGAPDASTLVELGGGDLQVRAGNDIDAGVYYVERGTGALYAGNTIKTNATRTPSLGAILNQAPLAPETWLPTTLFAGKAVFDISARGDVTLGPVVNPFLLPGGFNNTYWYKSYFSTYGQESAVNVSSLTGDVTLRQSATSSTNGAVQQDRPLLQLWMERVMLLSSSNAAWYQPWIRLNETSVAPFTSLFSLMPGTLRATAFSGDLNIVGDITLSPSPTGTLDLLAAGNINALNISGTTILNSSTVNVWSTGSINLSDADPTAIPGITTPFAYQTLAGNAPAQARVTRANFLDFIGDLFAESGSTEGIYGVLQTKQALHAPGLLHAGDTVPVHVYAGSGNISALTLFTPKATRIIAGQDITDIALYLQNVAVTDVSVISSGRDIVAYNPNTPLRTAARALGNIQNTTVNALPGDIQINGPGTLMVLAGRNMDLGAEDPSRAGTGLTSIGNARNPYLPFEGANIIVGAGLGLPGGLDSGALDFEGFINEFLDEEILTTYLAELGGTGVPGTEPPTSLDGLPVEQRNALALQMFYLVLRDAGRDYNDPASPNFGTYANGLAAIEALFPSGNYEGDISLHSRQIKTASGGDIILFAPGGEVIVGRAETSQSAAASQDQGVLTEAGGNISIFSLGNVSLGTSRIFTLRGGDIIIWSSEGDIAAGAASKTVQAAPPTRVLIDPQSGDVRTDLAGLATGGGIGVLATVEGVPPGDVDLVAVEGIIDASDAGIQTTGNLNLAATQVLNADNISAGGVSVGAPTVAVASSAPVGVTTSASNAAGGAAAAAAASQAAQQRPEAKPQEELPSIITVDVLGWGEEIIQAAAISAPNDVEEYDEEEKRRKREMENEE